MGSNPAGRATITERKARQVRAFRLFALKDPKPVRHRPVLRQSAALEVTDDRTERERRDGGSPAPTERIGDSRFNATERQPPDLGLVPGSPMTVGARVATTHECPLFSEACDGSGSRSDGRVSRQPPLAVSFWP